VKAGWHVKPLQSLCNDVKQDIVDGPFGSDLQRKDYITEGVPILKIQNVKAFAIQLKKMDYVSLAKFQELKRHSYRRGDIVMTKLGSPLGVSAIVGEMDEGVIVADLVRIRAQRINTKYLCYHLNSQRTNEFINSMQKGTTRPRVTLSVVRELPIAVPSPGEQQRIVGILDEAFRDIGTAASNAERNLQNGRALFESCLQSVFTRGGDGWVLRRLGEMCERITKGSSPTWQGIAYVEKAGVMFVTSENVGEFQILLDNPKFVEERFNEKDRKSILKRGDVLTNIVGASIGRTAVFDSDEVANINQAVCLIRCEPDRLNNYFLTYLLNSPIFKQLLHDNEVDNARANLSLGFFSRLLVPTPPLSEQKKIVATFDALREETQRLVSVYERKLAALEALKNSLLHRAFSGQL
jgi:type I restriction enzyme, S subunit